jgi:hypothetical protein
MSSRAVEWLPRPKGGWPWDGAESVVDSARRRQMRATVGARAMARLVMAAREARRARHGRRRRELTSICAWQASRAENLGGSRRRVRHLGCEGGGQRLTPHQPLIKIGSPPWQRDPRVSGEHAQASTGPQWVRVPGSRSPRWGTAVTKTARICRGFSIFPNAVCSSR